MTLVCGRRTRHRLPICLVCLLVLDATGCVQLPRRLQTTQRKLRGLVLILPGIEGPSVLSLELALGLEEGGVGSAIEVLDWTTGIPGDLLHNLTDLERNRRQAARIASLIREYRTVHPARPVHVIGHSGGGGVAVLALEALRADQSIDAAILLAPALSSTYDLTPALRRVSRALYSFHSEKDVTLLRLGTSVFGSVDRERGPAAGAVGFQTPTRWTAESQSLYEARLRQVAWSPRLAEYGADGTHLGWASRAFARDYLAPIIVQSEAARAAQHAAGE